MIKKIFQRLSLRYLTFYFYLKKAKLTPRNATRIVRFGSYKLKVADMLSFAWQYWEIIFKECYSFPCNSEKPVIIDCGANIGLSSIYFSKLYPNATIIAIEADPTIAAICKENIEQNSITNIELISKAAWLYNGKILFASDGADGGRIADTNEAKKEIDCIDLKELLAAHSAIDFLKMDIEGAESKVLPHIASQLSKVKNLFVEFHSINGQPSSLGNILTILSDNRFSYYIEPLTKQEKPFHSYPSQEYFDLQLNIYAKNNKL